MSATLDAIPSMIDRIRHDLVGLKMPRALEALDHVVLHWCKSPWTPASMTTALPSSSRGSPGWGWAAILAGSYMIVTVPLAFGFRSLVRLLNNRP